MKKSLLLYLLPLLFCACNYEMDPYNLQHWKEQMSMYMGTSVYNLGDSISFIRNNNEQHQFAIQRIEEYLLRNHPRFSPYDGYSDEKGSIYWTTLILQIGNEQNLFTFRLDNRRNECLDVAISFDDDYYDPTMLEEVTNNIDFSNDTLVLNSCQGNTVTLVRHVGITEIKSANGDIWELQENY